MSTTAQVLGVLQQTGGFLTGVVPNPPAKAPAGVAAPVAAVISYVKLGRADCHLLVALGRR